MVEKRRTAGRRSAVEFDQRRLGAYGEQRAAEWYQADGYHVLERNWRCRHGEIDLILGRGDEVVFCEVKTRVNDRYGTPFEAVGPSKQRRIRSLAARWLSEHPAPNGRRDVRFDVAGVVGAKVQVVQSAF